MLVCNVMLERKPDTAGSSVTESLERYLKTTLHDPVRVNLIENPQALPVFINRMYRLGEGTVAGKRIIFLADTDNTATPASIAKHVSAVRSAFGTLVVYVATSLSAYNRARLIARGTPFVVPGRQLYIPDLAMDLRERFPPPRQRSASGLSPASQAVLFHHLLRLDEAATTPSLIAEKLRYSTMSISRAFDDLVDAGLAHTEKHGKERHIVFEGEGRQLFDMAQGLLRSPVRTSKYVKESQNIRPLKYAGESALAQLTHLSPPRVDTLAVRASDWNVVKQTCGLVETGRDAGAHIVETWSYDPAGLTDASTVDPLSLYVQFRDHRDERISMAAERLLTDLVW